MRLSSSVSLQSSALCTVQPGRRLSGRGGRVGLSAAIQAPCVVVAAYSVLCPLRSRRLRDGAARNQGGVLVTGRPEVGFRLPGALLSGDSPTFRVEDGAFELGDASRAGGRSRNPLTLT